MKDKQWLKRKVQETMELKLKDSEKAGFTEDKNKYYAQANVLEGVLYLIDQLEEPEKVTVPAFVAEWIEKGKARKYNVKGFLGDAVKSEDVCDWCEKTDGSFSLETLTKAWLAWPNVEVEKEKRYYVLDKEDIPLLAKSNDEIYKTDTLLHINEDGRDKAKFELTEQEIKDYDERFWPFAVLVEEETP